MRGEKVLVIGCTGQVARPIAKALAIDNEVWGIARFNNAIARAELQASGVHCRAIDLTDVDLSGLPSDFSYLFNFSVSRTMAAPVPFPPYPRHIDRRPSLSSLLCSEVQKTYVSNACAFQK